MKHQLYSFNGVEVASPVEFSMELNDLDGDSKRNEAGYMTRIVIMSDIRKFSCRWQGLTIEEKNTILKNTSSREGHAIFECSFDNEYDEVETSYFYRGASKVTCTSIANGEKRYDLSFNIIETGRGKA